MADARSGDALVPTTRSRVGYPAFSIHRPRPSHSVGAFSMPKTQEKEMGVKPDNDMIRPLNPEHAANLMAEMTEWENAEITREEADNGDK